MPVTPTPPALMKLLENILEEPPWSGNQARLAEALHMTAAALGRVRRGLYPLGPEKCLRLAQATGRPPSDVLRAAGKGDLAALIEATYGKANRVSPAQTAVLAAWAQIPPPARATLRDLMARLAEGRRSRTAR